MAATIDMATSVAGLPAAPTTGTLGLVRGTATGSAKVGQLYVFITGQGWVPVAQPG